MYFICIQYAESSEYEKFTLNIKKTGVPNVRRAAVPAQGYKKTLDPCRRFKSVSIPSPSEETSNASVCKLTVGKRESTNHLQRYFIEHEYKDVEEEDME